MRTTALILLALGAFGFVAVLALLYFTQERLIFPASTLPADYRFAFEQPFEEIRIEVPGGATLDALHFRQPVPRGLVFFLHGNGGDLSSWTDDVDFYRRIDFDLFIFDYRGYGKSTGRIESEAQLHADVRAAWDRIAPAYAGKPIVIIGRSLGSGLAVRLACDVDAAMVVLVTPFVSLTAVAQRIYPFVPEWLLKYRLRTDTIAHEVKAPVLLIHGTHDELLPLEDSRALLAGFRTRKELIVIEGASHNDIHQFDAYRDGLAQRLVRLADEAGTARQRSQ